MKGSIPYECITILNKYLLTGLKIGKTKIDRTEMRSRWIHYAT